jgi:hypothetical protein
MMAARHQHLATMTMNTAGEFIWDNVFDYLDAKEVGRCTTVSSHINKCAQRHFKQIPTVVQVVQRCAWGKPRLELPLDGIQGENGTVYLNREKPFSQLYRMIFSALNLNEDEAYAVEVIYHGLLVGRPRGCNSPTFSTFPYEFDDPPHVYVSINFAYLEWKYITRHFPIEDWINDLHHTREARLFAEGEFLQVPSEYNQQLGAREICHHWYHPLWNHAVYEWIQDYTKPDSRPMQAYLALRKLEGTLHATISDKYGGFLTTLSYLSDRDRDQHPLMPGVRKFQWIPLYDFNNQVTYPGANEGVPYRPDRWNTDPRIRGLMPHFDRSVDWMDLRYKRIDTPYPLNPQWYQEDDTARDIDRPRWPRGNINVDEADETDET